MTHGKTVMMMAGGTGGHIFPALAVARALQDSGFRIVWLGSEGGMETRLVPEYGYPMRLLAIKGVRGNGLRRKLALPFTLLKTIRAARGFIQKDRVCAVVGFGGFVTFPGGIAARLSGIPLIVHEQNAKPGLSNRVLARYARRVLYAFPGAFPDADGFVGNPVRRDIAALPAPAVRFHGRTGPLKLAVLGGSLGADILNRTVPAALALLPEGLRPQVFHQAGRGKAGTARAAYEEAGVAAECVEFAGDMVSVYRDADLIVCRAGALTIAELAAAGVGALLVPYPHAVDDHQTANAAHMVEAGAALLLPQDRLDVQTLAEVLAGFDRDKCLKMAENARSLAMPDSAAEVAEIVTAVLN